MDVCHKKATGEDGSVPQHDDQSKELPLEFIWIIMRPARFVFSLCIRTPAPLCTFEVRLWINRVAREFAFQPFIQTPALRCTLSELHFFFLRDVPVACGTLNFLTY